MPLKIIVVGAGIGGPAAAACLAHNGHSVTILERSTTTTAVGYAFRITPNADRCLRHLGIDTVAGGAVAANTSRMLDQKGNVLVENLENKEKKDGGTSVFAFRPQLAQQLMDVAMDNGVEIRNGVKVKSVDVKHTSLTLDDGSSIVADLIIGADGVHSAIRPALVDSTHFQPRSSTCHTAVRWMISKIIVDSDPMLSTLINDSCRLNSWTSETKRIIVYPVDYGRQYNFTTTHLNADQERIEKGLGSADIDSDHNGERSVAYDNRISLGIVKKLYAEFEPRVQRIFELADPDGFRVWPLKDLDELPRWSDDKTCVIGDAAHLALPFGFSGASMAIEDAVVLGKLLSSDAEVKDIPDRLNLVRELRKGRVRHVRDHARTVGQGVQDPKSMQEYMKFLCDYNAVEEGSKALAQLALRARENASNLRPSSSAEIR